MQRLIFFLLFLIGFISCTKKPSQSGEDVFSENGKSNRAKVEGSYEATVVPNPEGGYGYEIFRDGKKVISQPHPPGKPGNKGFETQAEAKRIADFVISKITKGQIPPTITRQELDSLMAIH